MRTVLAIVVLALLAPRAGTAQWARRVVGHVWFRDVTEVPRGYQRPDDPVIGEMRFLVADDGSWCHVTPPEWVMVADGNDWSCRWRFRRGD